MNRLIYSILLASLLACNSRDKYDVMPAVDPDGVPPESSAPGFGSSKSRPEGTPFVFPAGVTLVDKPRADGSCWNQAKEQNKVRGSGGVVGFCLSFSNANDFPVRIDLPPGLIWIAEKNEMFQDISQNGIIVKTVTLHVPAHAIETAWLLTYCINVDRSTGRPGDSYESQPILTSHPGIKALAQQLANKKINVEDYPAELTDAERQQLAFVAVAVEDVETFGTVQPSTQVYLDKLPTVK